MEPYLLDMVECPACHGSLRWDDLRYRGRHLEEANGTCERCTASYPVREGIGLFLTPDLPRNDLWESVGGLMSLLQGRPDLEHRLMEAPLDGLGPADRFIRSFVLEERGDFASADAIGEDARVELYTEDFNRCWDRASRVVLDRLSAAAAPIVDIASGRGYLAEAMARELTAPIVMSDFSPRVLRRDRARLEYLGLAGRVSLLALDARRSPFRDGSITAMTSNLGFANIEQPGNLARELRRVLAGSLLAITHFFAEDDPVHAPIIRSRGGTLLFREPALAYLREAGLEVEVVNPESGAARPTPASVVTGAPIDLLPLAPTVLEWCVLVAR